MTQGTGKIIFYSGCAFILLLFLYISLDLMVLDIDLWGLCFLIILGICVSAFGANKAGFISEYIKELTRILIFSFLIALVVIISSFWFSLPLFHINILPWVLSLTYLIPLIKHKEKIIRTLFGYFMVAGLSFFLSVVIPLLFFSVMFWLFPFTVDIG